MRCNFWTQILCVAITMKVAVISKFHVHTQVESTVTQLHPS